MNYMNYLVFSMIVFLSSGCNQQSLEKMKFAGTVEITEHVLGVKMSGRLTDIVVNEGDVVTKGQQLATLDRYAQAKKDYERLAALKNVGGVTVQALENAQLALDDQQIIAPIDGIVLVKTAQAGETLMQGAGVVVVGNPHDQWIKVFVPEGVINQLKLNQPVSISFDGSTKIYQGHVSYIAIKAEFTPRNVQTKEERVTQAFAVKVAFDNPELTIRPGVAADVQFK